MQSFCPKILYFAIIFSVQICSQNNLDFFKAFESIEGDSILKHLRYLASDELEGRGLGSRGIKLAANYIADKYYQFDLKKIP